VPGIDHQHLLGSDAAGIGRRLNGGEEITHLLIGVPAALRFALPRDEEGAAPVDVRDVARAEQRDGGGEARVNDQRESLTTVSVDPCDAQPALSTSGCC
jgi:hypothetical protein